MLNLQERIAYQLNSVSRKKLLFQAKDAQIRQRYSFAFDGEYVGGEFLTRGTTFPNLFFFRDESKGRVYGIPGYTLVKEIYANRSGA